VFDPRANYELVSKTPRTDGGTVGLTYTPGVGMGARYTAASSNYSHFNGIVGLNKFPQTLLAVAKINATNANYRIAGTYQPTTQGWSISPVSTGSWRTFNNASPSTGGTSDTLPHVHMSTADNVTEQLSTYVDGAFQAGSPTTSTGTGADGFYIGSNGVTPAIYLDGIVYLAMLWRRKLNDLEIELLSKNPWQLFEAD
jgi:hypothetical protein